MGAGRHTWGAGFLADMEKYNTATMQGYRVLRFLHATSFGRLGEKVPQDFDRSAQ